MKLINLLLIFCVLVSTTPFAFAQTKQTFEVVAVIPDGKKSKNEDSKLEFSETSFKVAKKNSQLVIKEFNYADVQAADYSYAKKPMWSTTTVVLTSILLSPVFLATLFVKKKQHWLSVRTGTDYIVLKLDKDNYRQIMNEFEIRKVKVTTVEDKEESKKKEKSN